MGCIIDNVSKITAILDTTNNRRDIQTDGQIGTPSNGLLGVGRKRQSAYRTGHSTGRRRCWKSATTLSTSACTWQLNRPAVIGRFSSAAASDAIDHISRESFAPAAAVQSAGWQLSFISDRTRYVLALLTRWFHDVADYANACLFCTSVSNRGRLHVV